MELENVQIQMEISSQAQSERDLWVEIFSTADNEDQNNYVASPDWDLDFSRLERGLEQRLQSLSKEIERICKDTVQNCIRQNEVEKEKINDRNFRSLTKRIDQRQRFTEMKSDSANNQAEVPITKENLIAEEPLDCRTLLHFAENSSFLQRSEASLNLQKALVAVNDNCKLFQLSKSHSVLESKLIADTKSMKVEFMNLRRQARLVLEENVKLREEVRNSKLTNLRRQARIVLEENVKLREEVRNSKRKLIDSERAAKALNDINAEKAANALQVINAEKAVDLEEFEKCKILLHPAENDCALQLSEGGKLQKNLVELHARHDNSVLQLTLCQSELASCVEQAKFKEKEFKKLKRHVQFVEEENKKLVEKTSQTRQQLGSQRAGCHDGPYQNEFLTPFHLENTVTDVLGSINYFIKVYSAYKSVDGKVPSRDLVQNVCSSEVYISRPDHWKFLLKGIVSDCLFFSFETEKFTIGSVSTMDLNPEDEVRHCVPYYSQPSSEKSNMKADNSHPDDRLESLFLYYLQERARKLLPDSLRKFTEYDEESWKVTQCLTRAARKVWSLHKLCLAFEPRVTIVRVQPGDAFDSTYMESCVALEDDANFTPKVGFMIFPGFQLRKSVTKCWTYFGVQE